MSEPRRHSCLLTITPCCDSGDVPTGGHVENLEHALGLGARHVSAEFRDAVVAAATIDTRFTRGLLDKAASHEALERRVQAPRTRSDQTVRLPVDVLHESVTVPVTFGECEEDRHREWGQG